jgi:hypothetical protein
MAAASAVAKAAWRAGTTAVPRAAALVASMAETMVA